MHDLAGLLGQLLLATQLNASLLYTHLRSRSEGDLVYPEQDRAMDSVLQYPLIWPWTEVRLTMCPTGQTSRCYSGVPRRKV